ncbi:hypothetical protein PhCBS80983_g02367 [Powellomyces hirtus]|uniref:NmrA-like domain-containing protein n=1 Tax=Powellomyces hirtus TaxID=109895 RepID=A0A507E983_9FUNG|nr:hypothetical protein PhCBS80983_g02367 [Powellomyces hirtus]
MPPTAAPLNLLVTGASGHTTTSLINRLSEHPRKYNTHTISLSQSNDAAIQTVFEQTAFQAVYLVLPKTQHHCTEKVKMFLDIAKQNRVPFVIFVSSLGADTLTTHLAQRFMAIEAYLKTIRIPHTVLRVAPLQQTFMYLSDDFHQPIPTLDLPFSNGAFAPIHAADVARVAACILDNPTRHLGKTYTLTGPDLLTGVEIAGRASAGLDRPVRFRNCSPAEAKTHLDRIEPRLDPHTVTGVLALFDQIAAHVYNNTITSTVQAITAKPATHIDDFFRENCKLFNQYKDSHTQQKRTRRRGSDSVISSFVGSEGNGLGRFLRSKL